VKIRGLGEAQLAVILQALLGGPSHHNYARARGEAEATSKGGRMTAEGGTTGRMTAERDKSDSSLRLHPSAFREATMAKFPVLEALDAGQLVDIWRSGVRDMITQVRRDRLTDISEGQAGVFVAAALIVRSQEEWQQLELITDGDQDKDAYALWESLQDRKESVQFVLFNQALPERGFECVVEAQLHLAAIRASVAGLTENGYGVEGAVCQSPTPKGAGLRE
jgi:hypothetical protein